MKGRIVFLLEEPSMKNLLQGLLPRLFPGWVEHEHFLCVAHEGKSDLDRSIRVKLRAWRMPGDRFVIVRDNDNADCIDLKARLLAVCNASGRPDTLVRLICQELESWYIGDIEAFAHAFDPKLDTPALRKRFVTPDTWQKPSKELERLVPAFQKGIGARIMAQHLRETGNLSRSFNVFVAGLKQLAAQMGYTGASS
ncbi:MAG: DUF4276 family protein [Methyloversatilis sp.]|jgi:hypothetical protein|nr:DUF4276 family protein [Methyloversatilis sp.]MBP6195056.1 DUF4276 family protein [Methyloversatilis sp.]MBP9118732.1 DUF4276 family protein [Methyloversatilis sp.]